MKYLLTILLAVFFFVINAQTASRPADTIGDEDKSEIAPATPAPAGEEEIFTVVEEAPQFTGGMHKLYEFIARNIVYPQKEKEAGIQGKVFIKFVVEKDGTIGKTEVLRGVPNGKALDDEAVRVIKSMPAWLPGKQAGKAVRVYYNIPVSFKLDGK